MSWNPTYTPECPETGSLDAIETLIIPRTRDLGGFEVRRALPAPKRQMVGPFKGGRTSARQITLFHGGVGFATEDFWALRWLRAATEDTERFDMLDLLADPDVAQDLYEMLPRAEMSVPSAAI